MKRNIIGVIIGAISIWIAFFLFEILTGLLAFSKYPQDIIIFFLSLWIGGLVAGLIAKDKEPVIGIIAISLLFFVSIGYSIPIGIIENLPLKPIFSPKIFLGYICFVIFGGLGGLTALGLKKMSKKDGY